jgi:alkylmercury lyase
VDKVTKEKLIEEYRAAYAAIPQEALDLDMRVTIKTMQALARGKPVSPRQLAAIWEIPLEHVRAILKRSVARGVAQIDDQGNLVGGVLSLVKTPHRISVDGSQLFAWCAYDAIYAPGVLGKTAQIESKDPITGETIRLSITPDGVSKVYPADTVVTVVGAETDLVGGPTSPRCGQMLFFGSRESAEKWTKSRPDVSILSVEEVFEIARLFQIMPARRLGLV